MVRVFRMAADYAAYRNRDDGIIPKMGLRNFVGEWISEEAGDKAHTFGSDASRTMLYEQGGFGIDPSRKRFCNRRYAARYDALVGSERVEAEQVSRNLKAGIFETVNWTPQPR